ncbi:sulfotransferase family protein [Seongchinamella unica]|uniref:Sulfotransferase family protein n=2 Tax=Seongchinamella unica TaxID=2547392 RepID=A0A4R5LR02_9GAMM|nr:sulfotransferase family protein [Seongchinamella unica]
MHRSGTSCLTGSLQEAGLHMGVIHTWNPHNLKGNRENQQIVDINDRVLAFAGAAWDKPPAADIDWPQGEMESARELFASYADLSPFGFKDPRTLLTLAGWRQLFPHLQYIGIFRHPLAVAQSLANRSGMPIDQGLELWYEYNRRLLRQYREAAFPLLSFDDEQSLFQNKLQQVLGAMGFDATRWQGEFFDENLRSAHRENEGVVPWKVRRLYRKLQRLAA